MLIEFTARNYKSFQEMAFSMKPAPKQKGLDYSILTQKIGNKVYRGLCSSAIYGPNASGKTNMIGAMDTFKWIVLRGHIRNEESDSSPNTAAFHLELIPYRGKYGKKPVEFFISFIYENIKVEYGLSMDIGTFLDVHASREILSETLYINENLIFRRGQKDIQFGKLDGIREFLVNAFADNQKNLMEIARHNIQNDEIFLMNGFKTMFSDKLVSLIRNWIQDCFMVVYHADSIHVKRKKNDRVKKDIAYIDGPLNRAASCFGIHANELGYISGSDQEEPRLCSLFETKGHRAAGIPADVFESHGTIRFLNLFPLLTAAIQKGGTLIVDEFDASIHPMALMNLVNIFHNDDINIHGAQLIFNTHNPIFLDHNLFRRDEIKFVDWDEEKQCSVHYSLSDFKTAGHNGVRRGSDYMKEYFVDRYGAIKDIDLTPVFEELVRHKGGESE